MESADLATMNPSSENIRWDDRHTLLRSRSDSQYPFSMEGLSRSRRESTAESVDEAASLLSYSDASRVYHSIILATPGTPGRYRSHKSGASSIRRHGTLSRKSSFSVRLAHALTNSVQHEHLPSRKETMNDSKSTVPFDDRVWYDQFTSVDWVHDNIADAFRAKALRNRRGIWGHLERLFDASQGWILVAVVGCITACAAYFVNTVESSLYDVKTGYCKSMWYAGKKRCCNGAMRCDDWARWSELVIFSGMADQWIDYAFFILWVVGLALLSCSLTLSTRTVLPSTISMHNWDDNFAAEAAANAESGSAGKPDRSQIPAHRIPQSDEHKPVIYYPAAGSGVAEIKVITSGFVLHGYLGVKTLIVKTLALTLSVAAGLSIGKEGPFVHIATCVGNITSRMFPKYHHNDAKRREALSASAASGVTVAFGSPLGGVLFSLEEVSYYFPPKTLFRTFFCCIVAALFLKFLNPYGTGKIVLFEVRYLLDWRFFEMFIFILLGVMGGAMGAFFIKAARFWATTFRRIPMIKANPLFEVLLIALTTGIISWWNRYSRIPVTELMFELATPCSAFVDTGSSLCATRDRIPTVIGTLAIAFAIKSFLTTITFGVKVPAGIYVPSMVCGGLLGRIVGHTIQLLVLDYGHTGLFGSCKAGGAPEDCIVPGVYAMVAAGATMCGVTRLSVTLAVILFELTGSLNHVLPFSVAVLVSKWTADAIEPLSIYDLLTEMNAYPFLDNKIRPIFTEELGDLIPHHVRTERIIDLSESPLVKASRLRSQLQSVQTAGELDGGLPIVQDGILIGLIPAPDLEYALDRLDDEENSMCLMNPLVRWDDRPILGNEDDLLYEEPLKDPTDFTAYIDPAPVALDIHSPMDLVYECFVKLGLRYICALRDGQYAGLVHKKTFVKYTKDLELQQHRNQHH